MKAVARSALVVCLAAGFLCDYPWGDWVGHPHWGKVGWIPFISPPVVFLDMLQNLLLFMPAGAVSGAVFQARPVIAAALLTLPVAFMGEWTQLYSHSRFPSSTDLACNVAGAAIGAWLYRRQFVNPQGSDT